MSNNTATRQRPVSPHLQIYRWTPTMAMSIMHRITGIALYFGMLIVAWWLIAAATSASWFDTANAVLGSWFGLLVLVGFSWALIHHALGGVRHFVWDTGVGLEKRTSTLLSSLTLVGSVVLTAALWVAFYMVVRG